MTDEPAMTPDFVMMLLRANPGNEAVVVGTLSPEAIAVTIAHLTAQLAEPRATGVESGWQPIETAPKDETSVDLWAICPFDGSGRRHTDMWWQDGQWFGPDCDWGDPGPAFPGGSETPTHWCPIPKGPSE